MSSINDPNLALCAGSIGLVVLALIMAVLMGGKRR